MLKNICKKSGIDHGEVFAPVAKYNSILSLLAISEELDLEIHQMHVQAALLNSEVDEENYMQQADGFACNDQPDMVCKPRKSVYGLSKQLAAGTKPSIK